MKKNDKRVRMKIACFTLIILVLLTGCTNSMDEDQYISFSDYIEVTTTIEKYKTTMSSVPGLPIKIEPLVENTDYELSINVENGEFLSWEDGYITSLGQNVTHAYADLTIYWSPMSESIYERSPLSIQLIKEGEVIAVGGYQIVNSEDGYILLYLVLTEDK